MPNFQEANISTPLKHSLCAGVNELDCAFETLRIQDTEYANGQVKLEEDAHLGWLRSQESPLHLGSSLFHHFLNRARLRPQRRRWQQEWDDPKHDAQAIPDSSHQCPLEVLVQPVAPGAEKELYTYSQAFLLQNSKNWSGSCPVGFYSRL